MENDFLINKINAKVGVECHDKGNAIKTQWVVTTGTDLFQHWMQKNSKLNKTELRSLLTTTTMKMNSKYCKRLP